MLGKDGLFDFRDHERVKQHGVDHGGPLKLHHRTDPDQAALVIGEHVIVKWPSHTQWAARGERSANPTEYWLCRVAERKSPESEFCIRLECLKTIQPGRKRSLVKALIEECDALAAAEAE